MGITWSQIERGIARTEERKSKDEWFDCPHCKVPRQESFFDTLGIEHCAACYAVISIVDGFDPFE